MRYLLPGIAIAAALILVATSCLLNWTYWAGQGRDVWESHILGAAAVCFDILKSVLPVLIVWAIASKRYIEALVGSVVFTLLFAAALLSAIGFFSASRNGVSASQETMNAQLALATTESGEAESKLAGYPKTDTALAISAEMAAMRTNRRWTTTKECVDATATASREFCERYERLRGDHATAVARSRSEQKLADVRGEIRRLRSAGAGKDADPQSAILSRVISFFVPIDRTDANTGIVIFFAVLVELGAALGLYLSVSHWPARERKSKAQMAADGPTVTRLNRARAVDLVLPPPIQIKSLPTIEQSEAFKAWKESA